MPKEKRTKCIDDLRHAEYYQMQQVFDELYAKSSKGEKFTNLMEIILSRENILLAYRNIKTNMGSKTPGTDNITIKDIGRLTPEEVIEKVRYFTAGSIHGYRPKPVRRKDIPKANGKTRPLGIPCMWDRLIQQCIKQVMEPICEAKFSNNSFGFRPDRSVENAISRTYQLLQLSKVNYVIEIDIEGFFDNVNHSKLIKQIWSMGIQDKHLIYILKCILKAPIRMPDNSIIYPQKGTQQGGVISPLLANIVLNEFDYWIESQWQENPIALKYMSDRGEKGMDKSKGYNQMRKTKLKEMYIVRYADDIRLFCRKRSDAVKVKEAAVQWLSKRLKLNVSQEKTRIVNVKRKYSEFLGFKIRLMKKSVKHTVKSRMSDKALKKQINKLTEQVKNIAKPRKAKSERQEAYLYNSMVMGVQNYYCLATHICDDCRILNRRVMTILTNRLHTQKGNRLSKTGRTLTRAESKRYGKSKMLRYVSGSKEPIYPIGYIKHKIPMRNKQKINRYTSEGRSEIHDNLRINTNLLKQIMKQPLSNNSIEYADNRISLFSAQWGKCGVTGREFQSIDEIHCHHKIPKNKSGTDEYSNLILVSVQVHILIHATNTDIINKYLQLLQLDKNQMNKLNELRESAKLEIIQIKK